jgi:hypothetical protein
MDKVNLSKTLMVIRALEKDSDPFRPCQEGEECNISATPGLAIVTSDSYLGS